jgi:hypothetical protein
MPEGDWGDPPRQDLQPRPDADPRAQIVYPAQPGSVLRNTNPTCKICDRGTLRLKTAFRMSGPVVAIGFMLLISSVIGMFFCGFRLVAAHGHKASAPSAVPGMSSEPSQSAFDAQYRRGCAKAAEQYNQTAEVPVPVPVIEKYCECRLATFKETRSEGAAAETCTQRMRNGTLDAIDSDVAALYSDDIPGEGRAGAGVIPPSALDRSPTVARGILFFAGGLLGWLLVMRKRVLHCDICGAVINAS